MGGRGEVEGWEEGGGRGMEREGRGRGMRGGRRGINSPLMSLWMTPCSWRWATPCRICCEYLVTVTSSNAPYLDSNAEMEPPEKTNRKQCAAR